MNNEEKILAMLEKMDERQNKTEAILEKLTNDVDGLKAGQNKLEAGQKAIIVRLDKIEDDVEEVKEKLTAVNGSIGVLTDWAEKVEVVTKIQLLPNVN